MQLMSSEDLIGSIFHLQLLHLGCKPFEDTLVILLNNILGNYRKYCSDMRKTCFNVEGDQVLERLPRVVAEFLCLEMLRLPLATCFGWVCFMEEPGVGDLQSSLAASAVRGSLLVQSFSDCIELGMSSNMSASLLVERKPLGMGLYKPWLQVAFQFRRICEVSKYRAHLFPGCCCPQLRLTLCVDSIGTVWLLRSGQVPIHTTYTYTQLFAKV